MAPPSPPPPSLHSRNRIRTFRLPPSPGPPPDYPLPPLPPQAYRLTTAAGRTTPVVRSVEPSTATNAMKRRGDPIKEPKKKRNNVNPGPSSNNQDVIIEDDSPQDNPGEPSNRPGDGSTGAGRTDPPLAPVPKPISRPETQPSNRGNLYNPPRGQFPVSSTYGHNVKTTDPHGTPGLFDVTSAAQVPPAPHEPKSGWFAFKIPPEVQQEPKPHQGEHPREYYDCFYPGLDYSILHRYPGFEALAKPPYDSAPPGINTPQCEASPASSSNDFVTKSDFANAANGSCEESVNELESSKKWKPLGKDPEKALRRPVYAGQWENEDDGRGHSKVKNNAKPAFEGGDTIVFDSDQGYSPEPARKVNSNAKPDSEIGDTIFFDSDQGYSPPRKACVVDSDSDDSSRCDYNSDIVMDDVELEDQVEASDGSIANDERSILSDDLDDDDDGSIVHDQDPSHVTIDDNKTGSERATADDSHGENGSAYRLKGSIPSETPYLHATGDDILATPDESISPFNLDEDNDPEFRYVHSYANSNNGEIFDDVFEDPEFQFQFQIYEDRHQEDNEVAQESYNEISQDLIDLRSPPREEGYEIQVANEDNVAPESPIPSEASEGNYDPHDRFLDESGISAEEEVEDQHSAIQEEQHSSHAVATQESDGSSSPFDPNPDPPSPQPRPGRLPPVRIVRPPLSTDEDEDEPDTIVFKPRKNRAPPPQRRQFSGVKLQPSDPESSFEKEVRQRDEKLKAEKALEKEEKQKEAARKAAKLAARKRKRERMAKIIASVPKSDRKLRPRK
ncbi:hypothetical protein K440DRAFT_658675 [Wilcoxina mikolae CBS 423.85]|nr:hypothetical protein K440DRAFT_658675 [Wilcoxina mikolae CBS 423.85]